MVYKISELEVSTGVQNIDYNMSAIENSYYRILYEDFLLKTSS